MDDSIEKQSSDLGLSPEDHFLLNQSFPTDENGVIIPKELLFAQKREEYKTNFIALEEIDRYDPNSSYRILIRKLYCMLNEGDSSELKSIRAEIFEKYPLTSKNLDSKQ